MFPPNNETLRLFSQKNLLRKKKICAICVICVRFLSHTDFANGADFLLLHFQIIERNVRKTGEDYLIGTGIDLRISSGTDGLNLFGVSGKVMSLSSRTMPLLSTIFNLPTCCSPVVFL